MSVWDLFNKRKKNLRVSMISQPDSIESESKKEDLRIALLLGGDDLSQDCLINTAFKEKAFFSLNGCQWHISKTAFLNPNTDQTRFNQLIGKAHCVFLLHEDTEQTKKLFEQYQKILGNKGILIQMFSEEPIPDNLPSNMRKIKLTRAAFERIKKDIDPLVTSIDYSIHDSASSLFQTVTPAWLQSPTQNFQYCWGAAERPLALKTCFSDPDLSTPSP